MKKNIPVLLICSLIAFTSAAKELDSLVLLYDEIEQGVGSQPMRYIINDEFLRIDDGNDKSDFILFDVKKKTIYSINHDDRTILKIENKKWETPVFDFKVITQQNIMKEAPKISGKEVHSYLVKAGEMVCTQVSFVKDMYPKKMQVLYQYQQVLSGQQVATLGNTPKEMHTPCFLIDQVYHSGEYYKSGLPVHISYSRGYEKFLKNYKTRSFDEKIFLIPEAYEIFSAAF